MEKLNKSIFLASIVGFIGTMPAEAYDFPGVAYCPDTKSGSELHMTWQKYISMRGLPKNARKEATFEVRFDHSKKLGDTDKNDGSADVFGNIYTGSCYTVSYTPGGHWSAAGFSEKKHESDIDNATGGNPRYFHLNIWGHMFSYDNSGAVWDAKYGLVGSLHCDLSNACYDYGTKSPPPPNKGGLFSGTSTKYPLGQNSTPSNAVQGASNYVSKRMQALPKIHW